MRDCVCTRVCARACMRMRDTVQVCLRVRCGKISPVPNTDYVQAIVNVRAIPQLRTRKSESERVPVNVKWN